MEQSFVFSEFMKHAPPARSTMFRPHAATADEFGSWQQRWELLRPQFVIDAGEEHQAIDIVWLSLTNLPRTSSRPESLIRVHRIRLGSKVRKNSNEIAKIREPHFAVVHILVAA